ncbi:thioredoxin-like protein [Delitschia confertaspora ATCC 74209]|uniref:Thioredoxin-like protein n=1 Tax=Delitschia confertaspora ATCC 74209 TaxID=1513339 RepID=A0A9P4MZX1_9PLEO|nr:thioredoxin-like protein [Delitschia confertaspora ATCC 74209]
MTTNAAQDEFNELFRDKDRESRHPEDRTHSDESESEPESPAHDFYPERTDTDDELELDESVKMRSNYYLPSIRSEANTGPKGVIADAHAFEQAKKQARRSIFTRKTSPPSGNLGPHWNDGEKSSEEDGEEGFMRRWRENRLRELQNAGSRIRSRTSSPSQKIYGRLEEVDGEGFLEAVEKVRRDAVVVVFIYDDLSEISTMVEACVHGLARKHSTVRFIKLHYEEAEMEIAGVPALLAYRNGDKFAGLVPVMDELPDDAELSEISLEVVLRR